MQPPPPSVSRTFHVPELRLCPHETLAPHLLPHPWLPPSTLCLCGRDSSRGSRGTCPFVPGFCHCSVSSGSAHVVAGGRTSFLFTAGSYSSVWTDTVYPSLWLILPGTWGCKCPFETRPLLLFGIDQTWTRSLCNRGAARSFPQWPPGLTLPQPSTRAPTFHILTDTCYALFCSVTLWPRPGPRLASHCGSDRHFPGD